MNFTDFVFDSLKINNELNYNNRFNQVKKLEYKSYMKCNLSFPNNVSMGIFDSLLLIWLYIFITNWYQKDDNFLLQFPENIQELEEDYIYLLF